MKPLEFIKSKFNFPKGSSYSLPQIRVIQCAAWMKEYNELQSAWISVEDRLPENDEDVFCYSPELDPAFFVGWYYRTDHPRGKNGWEGRISERGESTTALDDAENVTHWQPLPSPPTTK